jgi:hypothetical protein
MHVKASAHWRDMEEDPCCLPSVLWPGVTHDSHHLALPDNNLVATITEPWAKPADLLSLRVGGSPGNLAC